MEADTVIHRQTLGMSSSSSVKVNEEVLKKNEGQDHDGETCRERWPELVGAH